MLLPKDKDPIWCRKAPPDFIGKLNGVPPTRFTPPLPVMFEVKSFDGASFPLNESKLKRHQLHYLLEWILDGSIGFFFFFSDRERQAWLVHPLDIDRNYQASSLPLEWFHNHGFRIPGFNWLPALMDAGVGHFTREGYPNWRSRERS